MLVSDRHLFREKHKLEKKDIPPPPPTSHHSAINAKSLFVYVKIESVSGVQE
jgi:hypothetical protein